MKKIVLVLVLLTACGYGAYRHLTAPPPPLVRLARVPETFPTGSQGGIRQILPTGEIGGHRVPGRHTVIVVSATWCGPCQSLAGYLRDFAVQRPDVAIRKIDVDEAGGWDAVRQKCKINLQGVPHVIIYDADGELVAQDVGKEKDGLKLLNEWLNHELQQAYERRTGGG